MIYQPPRSARSPPMTRPFRPQELPPYPQPAATPNRSERTLHGFSELDGGHNPIRKEVETPDKRLSVVVRNRSPCEEGVR